MSIDAGELARARQLLVATRILRRRKALGLTQQACVDRLVPHGYEITDGTWSNMEKGVGLDVGKLVAAAIALDASEANRGKRGKHLRSDPTGEVVGHREHLRDQLHTAYREVQEARRLLKAARGRCNVVARGLTERDRND